jgi:hypothetical protein
VRRDLGMLRFAEAEKKKRPGVRVLVVVARCCGMRVQRCNPRVHASPALVRLPAVDGVCVPTKAKKLIHSCILATRGLARASSFWSVERQSGAWLV